MRKLILIRGPQGAGKTTWLKKTGLIHYSLSMDQLRLASSGLVLTTHGHWSINQDVNEQVHHLFRRLANERMERGELLCIEGALMDVSDTKYWMEQALFHRYQICMVDLSDIPTQQLLHQNAQRPIEFQVHEKAVIGTQKRLKDSARDLPKELLRFTWQPQDAHWSQVEQWMSVPMVDLSHYEKIVHIGDLQGCLTVLTGPNGLLEKGFEPNTHYILMGDLLDRGIENHLVMQWVLKEVINNPHVTLIWGNHENHLHRWARGLKAVSQEFAQKTLPQLLKAGLTTQDAELVCQKAIEMLTYKFHDKQVLISHAGLSTVPEKLERVSLHQYSKGTGAWSDPIDQQFDRQAPLPWEQVHGHRNHNHQKIQASQRSFSLEDNVEYGGHLRVATLTKEGWSTASYPNFVFLPYRDRPMREEELQFQPEWLKTPSNMYLSAEDLKKMREHPGVKEKVSESNPHVASFNFTKDVFFNQAWDDVVVRARGLFFNQKTGEIVARAYDKFFNFEEPGIEETKPEQLQKNIAWPIVGYQKENGFLGLMGYDSQTDSLFLTSKSTPDSDFATWFKDIFNEMFSVEKQENLKRYLRDCEACVALEVIDPIRDPHMITYDKPNIVVLDVFARSSKLQKLSYEQLKHFGNRFGLNVKQKEVRLPNWQAFEGWHNRVKDDLAHQSHGKAIEGVVFEDANGFQFKVKYAYYSFWKSMRGTKDRISSTMEKKGISEQAKKASIQANVTRYNHPLAFNFLSWCQGQNPETLNKDIITLRNQFEQEVSQDPSWIKTPWNHKALVLKSSESSKPTSPEKEVKKESSGMKSKP